MSAMTRRSRPAHAATTRVRPGEPVPPLRSGAGQCSHHPLGRHRRAAQPHPGRIERGARTVHGRRRFRVPGSAVAAHALHPHRFAGESGQQRGIKSGIARVVAAVGIGSDHSDAVYLFRRQSEHTGYAVTGEMRFLRSGPERGAIGFRIDNRAARAHAGMRLERPFVLGLDHACSVFERRCHVTPSHGLLALDGGRRADVAVDFLRRWERLASAA